MSLLLGGCGLAEPPAVVTPTAAQAGADAGDRASPRGDAPELAPNLGWLNTDRPLELHDDLRGHVVVLDFWTYCCINCIHTLPDLEFLGEKYADQPVAIVGVHSAKFTAEGERRGIRNAMLRYGVKHPVVVDDGMRIWDSYGVRAWPTVVVVDPEGNVVGATSGEGKRGLLDRTIASLLREHGAKGTLAESRVEITPEPAPTHATGLRYPGKVALSPPDPAAGRPGRLFVADSSNHRVIVASWPKPPSAGAGSADAPASSRVLAIYGGERGFRDGGPAGSAEAATFSDPQGMAFHAESNTLYVADRANHAVRAIGFANGAVTTVLGTGERGTDRRGGGRGTSQDIASPWDLQISPGGDELLIAAAGTHQLWSADLDGFRARAVAGSGGENVIDAPGLRAELAQPSGFALSSDGSTLYFTDTEGSAIRGFELEGGEVDTVIGRDVGRGRFETGLFTFGDRDGFYPDARLQHAIGITLFPTPEGDRLMIADTYNDKLKLVDPRAKSVETWLGVGRDEPAGPSGLRFDEPAGVVYLPETGALPASFVVADTNNHRLVLVDASTKAWRELALEGLPEPGLPLTEKRVGRPRPVPSDAAAARVAAGPGPVTLAVSAGLPEGWKLNSEATAAVVVSRVEGGRVAGVVAQRTLPPSPDKAFPIEVELPESDAAAGAELLVELSYVICDADVTACVPGDATWLVTLAEASADDGAQPASLVGPTVPVE